MLLHTPKFRIRSLYARSLIGLATLLAFCASTRSVQADLVVYEGFDYNTGALSTANGGTGFAAGWSESSSGTPAIAIESPGLSFSSLPVSGNAIGRSSNANRAEANRSISTAATAALTADNSTIWFSVLWRPGATGTGSRSAFMFGNGAFGTGAGNPQTGADGFGFSPFDGGQQTNVYAHGWVSGDASDNPNTSANTGITHSLDDTLLLAGKINWLPNGTADEFFLFNITDPAITEPTEASALASITNIDFDQSTWNSIAIFENHRGSWDEIRLGSSFDSVMGRAAIPEPSTLTLFGFGLSALILRRRGNLGPA